jgi:hypothetical protein
MEITKYIPKAIAIFLIAAGGGIAIFPDIVVPFLCARKVYFGIFIAIAGITLFMTGGKE